MDEVPVRRAVASAEDSHHVKFNIGMSADKLDDASLESERLLSPVRKTSRRFLGSSRNTSLSSLSEMSHTEDLEPLINVRPDSDILVELYDLKLKDSCSKNGVWEETARWIKYEEDVEGVDHRWGQPHVAFLSFHALLQLRKCIEKGTLILDVTIDGFPQLCDIIAKAVVEEGHCAVSADKIKEMLFLQQSRVRTRRPSRISVAASFFDSNKKPTRSCSAVPLNRRSSDYPIHNKSSLNTVGRPVYAAITEADDGDNRQLFDLVGDSNTSPNNKRKWSTQYSRKRSISHMVSSTFHELKRVQSKDDPFDYFREDMVLKRLPLNTESAQVFVGSVPEMKRVRFVMVRFHNPQYINEIVDHNLPVKFVFIILGPSLVDLSYHELGRALCTLMANKDFNGFAYSAICRGQLIRAIDNFLDESVVIPPGEVDSKRLLSGNEIKKALKRRLHEIEMTRHKVESMEQKQKVPEAGTSKDYRFFNGMINDIANRFPKYGSDFTDALNFQCLTSVVFMFFASFAPAITFGGLLGKYTNEKIGMIETLFAQCICGIIWGLFSAQPLMIMSATGPVLIFEASLYIFCESLNFDFMVIRLYAGIWVLVIAIVTVALDGSRLLAFVTRFTEDIFATLISAIFIAESIEFVYHTFQENPVENFDYYETIHSHCNLTLNVHNDTAEAIMSSSAESYPCTMAEPNTALLTAIIMFGTFVLAILFKKLRESFYLGRHLRRAIGDFGVLISIAIVAFLVHVSVPDPYIQRLDMPDHINFTNPENRGHGLIIDGTLTKDNFQGVFVSFIAAMLVFILLFVETEITELLLSRKERGCVKGNGMNWDLVLIGVCALLCSVFGLPWMCAAAVQSLAHCSSLTVTKKKAPGARLEVDHVIEQRVTTIGVSLLIGAIAFAGSYLRLPLASLFGVFLYLGVMNMCGVQLIQRVVLFFIPEKYLPVTPYTEQVGIWRMHLFTWIQIICLSFIYMVKHYKKTALAFPFVLMLFIMFRELVLPKVFTDKELKALDGEEGEDEEWMDKDFYENAPIPV
ncbi:unnamed protein product [Bursaphelenchus okinawaensis]|uniref:Anion exchange protein n=1 Tax=Bursaphelenchus okinawaensis TaxID=465554 RepID=A0A811KUB2_9BILA|nr:unnamed protein product [Bursaphelenchus okinawaensis]CAG9112369.1 unnamed protein product [Bursaphelenchus okinawaensis]